MPDDATSAATSAATVSDTVPVPTFENARVQPYAWYVLGVLVLLYVLNFIDRQIVSILVEDIKADLGATDAEMGFLTGAAFGVFYALFGIPLGKLADEWHRVRLIAAGLTVWSLFTALSGFAKSFGALSLARLGVGVGEATASPAAYSLISDWFPKRMRGTALALYSSGLYLGGGVSLLIGAVIVQRWNAAYPGGGPLGLVGWQAAFLAVGLPGLLLALLILTLREPNRGQSEGIVTPPNPHPFRGFGQELFAIIPPLTLVGAARQGLLAQNLAGMGVVAAVCSFFYWVTGSGAQWSAIGIGYYAVFSWALTLRRRDPAAFTLIWGNPAFLCTILGYGTVAFVSYAVSGWSPAYAERVLGVPKTQVAFWLGSLGALGGFLGVIIGGRVSDWLRARNPAGRILVVGFGVLAPIVPLIIAFTTTSWALFVVLSFVLSLFGSSALGAAAATSQDLVLPRMRGTATATFFLATTLVGLSLGPYLVGQVSTASGSLSTGVLSLLVASPIGLGLLIAAYRLVPAAEASVLERARAAGEPG